MQLHSWLLRIPSTAHQKAVECVRVALFLIIVALNTISSMKLRVREEIVLSLRQPDAPQEQAGYHQDNFRISLHLQQIINRDRLLG